MSEDSWKAEYYPIEASMVKGILPALFHSKRKWVGARAANLKRHGLDTVPICFSLGTCAVCNQYSECAGCLLLKAYKDRMDGRPCGVKSRLGKDG